MSLCLMTILGFGVVKDFKAFVTRGNVIDLAVGLVMGAAFMAVVTSMVNDLFTPLIGYVIGGRSTDVASSTTLLYLDTDVYVFRCKRAESFCHITQWVIRCEFVCYRS
jgi:large conductance mechanosensitive channel protein